MKIITMVFESIKRDKSYLIGAIFTLGALTVLLTQHNWQSRALSDGSQNIVNELPDFSSIRNITQKKKQFFAYLRPLIAKENQKIRHKKALLLSLIERIESDRYHSGINSKKLHKLAIEFGLNPEKLDANLDAIIDELNSRIDIIPSSLVLAQAANESAWGTSRFATQANNLFGQWCYTEGCGLIPKRRNAGNLHEVRTYPSIQASISSYMLNLNSHRAYADLRNIRAGLRRRGQQITGVKLAHGLSSYSERGQAYVDELISMIRHNGLE